MRSKPILEKLNKWLDKQPDWLRLVILGAVVVAILKGCIEVLKDW